ncbi:MAG TPA: VOC family protein [Gemmatimonadaceae bacterium]|nr:VOC family protein [Gemmatimonadaceae bacterium]
MTQSQQLPSSQPYDAFTAAPEVGRFVWHDLMTTDPERAAGFYAALVGWTISVVPMGELGDYTMVHAGETAVGGIVPLDPAHGVASHWVPYVTVAEVNAACEHAAELGGAICVPPTDIPGIGRFAVLEDPEGAIFSPFAPLAAEPLPAGDAALPPGAFCWDELMSPDPTRAARFYGALLGWQYRVTDMGALGHYWLARRGEREASGMLQLPEEATAAGTRPHWLPYLLVDHVDASADRAAAAGGTVVIPPTDIPGLGRFAVLRDPTQALIAVYRAGR